MSVTLKYRFMMRRGTLAEWTAANEVPLLAEWCLQTGTPLRFKVGDGATHWLDLPYVSADNWPEGADNLYFTKPRVADSLVGGTGVKLDVDVDGNTTISTDAATGNLLTDWTNVQLQDWAGDDLQDWTTSAVSSVFGRAGTVVAANGDYTTDQVTEGSAKFFTAARTLAVALTGLSTSAGTAVVATDSILVAIGKLQAQANAPKLPEYTLTALPTPASNQRAVAFCSNSSAGYVPVWCDGTNWRIFADNTIVS